HPRRRESEPHDTLVVGIPRSFDQARGNGAVNQLHRAVVPEQQVTGGLADGGTSGIFVATDGEQELMLGRSEPHRGRLIPTPSQESSEAGAELQETSILGVSDPATHRQPSRHRISYRSTILYREEMRMLKEGRTSHIRPR